MLTAWDKQSACTQVSPQTTWMEYQQTGDSLNKSRPSEIEVACVQDQGKEGLIASQLEACSALDRTLMKPGKSGWEGKISTGSVTLLRELPFVPSAWCQREHENKPAEEYVPSCYSYFVTGSGACWRSPKSCLWLCTCVQTAALTASSA